MVLEDATTNNGFGDDAPPSDGDSYNYNQGDNSPSYYSMPADLPYSPFVSDARMQDLIVSGRRHHSQILGRPLTPEEAQFSAYWAARLLTIQSYGRPLGILAGAWRAWETRSTFKFPFLGSRTINNPSWNPDVFVTERFAFARGAAARGIWHGFRTTVYCSIGMAIGHMFFTGYAMSVCTVGAKVDPRGKEIFKAIADKQKQFQGAIGARRRGEAGQQPQPQPQQQQQYETGMSSSPPDAFQEPAPIVGFESPSEEASPITQPSGSAWDRVRQQAATGKSPSTSRWRKQPAPQEVDEAFSGSKVEEDIREAREKAQKEFDERVENERHGGSFDSGKGDTDRW